ncbi:transposase [Labrys neptuniae]|uniref:Transposase n=1 Tax=Labrys neptuniae TaxID=376174 RepID=A0ABV3PW69_9HYPH
MLIAEMPELGRMTAGQAAAMTGLASVPYDSGTMRGRRMIVGGRRALRHVLFQAALAAACHNAVLRPLAKRLKERAKPHKLSSSQLHASWSQSQTPSLKRRLHGA